METTEEKRARENAGYYKAQSALDDVNAYSRLLGQSLSKLAQRSSTLRDQAEELRRDFFRLQERIRRMRVAKPEDT